MTASPNGAIPAAPPGAESALPYGEGRVGTEVPPPPPPTEADGLRARLTAAERDLAGWESWSKRIEDSNRPKRASQTLATVRAWPKRYAVSLCIASATLVTTVGIVHGTPRHSEKQVATMAANQVLGQVSPEMDAKWADMRAEATNTVETAPLSVYGLDLTEDAKTAIGWVGTPGNLKLNEERAEYVAKQVRVLSAKEKLLDLRLTSKTPTDLRVHTNVAEGFSLFSPPATQAPPPAAATATSAP